MEYLATAEEMRAYDRRTIEEIGIPAMVLMERAALSALEEIEALHSGRNILILAGMGNNGGDGLALARLLAERDYAVEVVLCGDEKKASEQWKCQRAILAKFPAAVGRKPSEKEYNILVDALFGVGLSREITGPYAEAIAWWNAAKGFKIAMDVPSGVHSDSGNILGCAAKADMTICFGIAKRGLYLYPGCDFCGQVKVKDIGIGVVSLKGMEPQMFRYTEPVGKLLPPRSGSGNKGTFGKVLLAAGSRNMAGAAVLAAKACYAGGAGMVKVITPECNRLIVQTAVPEALYAPADPETYCASLDWADVCAVGPGLGRGDEALALLETFIRRSGKPLVIDADGLNLLAENTELQEELTRQAAAGRKIILTPHMGELSRLMKESIAQLKAHPAESALRLAKRLHCIVAAKDARTVICKENHPICLNTAGNSGMATAGSGDVLTGIIAALLAQGAEPFEAAAVGVYWHAAAGDAAAKDMGEYAVTASAVISHMEV